MWRSRQQSTRCRASCTSCLRHTPIRTIRELSGAYSISTAVRRRTAVSLPFDEHAHILPASSLSWRLPEDILLCRFYGADASAEFLKLSCRIRILTLSSASDSARLRAIASSNVSTPTSSSNKEAPPQSGLIVRILHASLDFIQPAYLFGSQEVVRRHILRQECRRDIALCRSAGECRCKPQCRRCFQLTACGYWSSTASPGSEPTRERSLSSRETAPDLRLLLPLARLIKPHVNVSDLAYLWRLAVV